MRDSPRAKQRPAALTGTACICAYMIFIVGLSGCRSDFMLRNRRVRSGNTGLGKQLRRIVKVGRSVLHQLRHNCRGFSRAESKPVTAEIPTRRISFSYGRVEHVGGIGQVLHCSLASSMMRAWTTSLFVYSSMCVCDTTALKLHARSLFGRSDETLAEIYIADK